MNSQRQANWFQKLRNGLRTSQWRYEVFYEDPSSTETHRLRRQLLLLSLIAFAVGPGGILPQRIAALGIETGELNRSVLLAAVLGIVIYYIVSFSLHSLLSLHAWKRRALAHVVAHLKQNEPLGNTDPLYAQNAGVALSREFFWQPVVRWWVVLEVVLPIAIAVTAITAVAFLLARS